MNIVHSIVVTEYFEHIVVSIIPFYDNSTTKTQDRISIREGETEFIFCPDELYDISHINFELTDISKNHITIKLTTNSVDNAVIYRHIDKDEDFIDILTSNNSIKSIPTYIVKNVIDAYDFVEAEIAKIKDSVDDKYNKLKVTV